MGDVISIFSRMRKPTKEEEEIVHDLFSETPIEEDKWREVMERNAKNQRRLASERNRNNLSVLDSYRIRRPRKEPT